MTSAIVVGGGLCGMTAAYRLKQAGYEVTVYEKCPHPEGRIKSVRVGDCIIDTSATMIGATYDQLLALIDELGLGDQVETCHGNTVTYRNGKAYLLSIDRPNLSLALTPLLSLKAKFSLLRLLSTSMKLDKGFNFYNLGAGRGADNETLYEFCSRNFPDEVYEYLLNPMHKFLCLHDGKYGTAVELLWWLHALGTAAPRSMKYGMHTVVRKLAVGLTVHCNAEVQRVTHDGKRASVTVSQNGTVSQVEADVCVVTTPPPVAAAIYPAGMTPEQHAFVASRHYEKVTAVSFCTSVRPKLDVVSIQMPSSQNIDLGTILFGHKIASTRAPADKGIVNTYFLNAWTERHAGASDQEIMEAARREIVHLVPEVAALDGYHVEHWDYVAPIHEFGARARIDSYVNALDPASPVQVVGDYLASSSMNVAVTIANRLAASIVDARRH